MLKASTSLSIIMFKQENLLSTTGEENDDDDASEEGRLNRMLFADDEEDSSCCSEKDNELFTHNTSSSSHDPDLSTQEKDQDNLALLATSCFMDKILFKHKSRGGSIAEILWPAAQYLAEFISSHSSSIQPNSASSQQPDHTSLYDSKNKKEQGRSTLTSILQSTFSIIELGAGLGLTGIQLATVFPCHVLLTDLDVAIPLLHTNICLNAHQFKLHPRAVHARRLEWGTDDWKSCWDTLVGMIISHLDDDPARKSTTPTTPVLLLASDCVYFEHLHQPLEQTLVHVLSHAPPESLCLIAGVRRWKRDTAFFTQLGKRTKTTTHELSCVCIDEQVIRRQSPLEESCKNKKREEQDSSSGSRCIMRIYAIQWVPRRTTSAAAATTRPYRSISLIPQQEFNQPIPTLENSSRIIVIFGRPGAGKSTLSEAVVHLFHSTKNTDKSRNQTLIPLDLDVCIPPWMQDNFAKGLYPTLEQRQDFAHVACDYVEQQWNKAMTTTILETQKSPTTMTLLISFSFVNTDLRDLFRIRFPRMKWILVHVSDSVAQERIQSRQDHFYKGQGNSASTNPGEENEVDHISETQDCNDAEVDLNEWKFAPVTFDHIALDGLQSVDCNAQRILDVILNEE